MSVVRFAINPAAGIDGSVVDGPAATGGTLQLTAEFSVEDWETIDLLMLFHLGWDERHPGSVSGQQPVQVELRLDPQVAAASGVLDDPARLAVLADDDPALDQASWYALNATEAVELPPGLADAGEVRSGFSTIWTD